MSNRVYPIKRQKSDERDLKVTFSRPVKLSTKVDLRSGAPVVFDQGSLGSCSANAGCAAMMMLESKTNGVNISSIPVLSRLFLYYQERVIENTVNEDSGAAMRDICKALNKTGVCEEKYFPYVIEKFTKAPTATAMTNAVKHKIGAYKSLATLADIKKYLDTTRQPVMIGMDIFESFEAEEIAANGIMPMPSYNEQNLGGHAVLVVGYDDNFVTAAAPTSLFGRIVQKFTGSNSKGALIVRNSWGDQWGDKGYFYMPYSYVTKKFAFDFWTISM